MSTRRKPGPKTEVPAGEDVKPVTYTVDSLTRRRLVVLGNGNESAGVRTAARVAYERYQREEDKPAPYCDFNPSNLLRMQP